LLTTVKGMEMAMHDPRHMRSCAPRISGAHRRRPHARPATVTSAIKSGSAILAYEDDQSWQILKTVTGWT